MGIEDSEHFNTAPLARHIINLLQSPNQITKMKLAFATAIVSTVYALPATNSTTTPLVKQQRRFEDFKRLFEAVFDPTEMNKIYGYGCYCLNRGDRPQTGYFSGVEPVDEVDELCHKWSKCNRCAARDHDDTCTPESTKYKFQVLNRDTREIKCTNPEGSCARDLCECDKWAVQNMDDVLDNTQTKFLASEGFDAFKECKIQKNREKSVRGDVQCCGDYPRLTFVP